jgi:proteasome assembly chaperone (PAC2) family protein
MDKLKIYKKIDFVNPVMISGWPGMGSVASGVVGYLIKKLNAVRIAEITANPIDSLDSVRVNNGLAAFPPPPRNIFYYCNKPELILFEGESQMAGEGGSELLNTVLDYASQAKVKIIYTGAAFPMPVSHRDIPHLYGAVNSKSLLQTLSKFGISRMENGHIAGLNGLMLGFARARSIDAVCLLATMPQYAIGLPNPKASLAIIEQLQNMLGFNADLSELSLEAREMDEKMAIIEDKVKDVLIIDKDEHHIHASGEKRVPEYIVDKIERMFGDAKNDRTKAIVLKKELDRWDLYHKYEDRFLNLFKDR